MKKSIVVGLSIGIGIVCILFLFFRHEKDQYVSSSPPVVVTKDDGERVSLKYVKQSLVDSIKNECINSTGEYNAELCRDIALRCEQDAIDVQECLLNSWELIDGDNVYIVEFSEDGKVSIRDEYWKTTYYAEYTLECGMPLAVYMKMNPVTKDASMFDWSLEYRIDVNDLVLLMIERNRTDGLCNYVMYRSK